MGGGLDCQQLPHPSPLDSACSPPLARSAQHQPWLPSRPSLLSAPPPRVGWLTSRDRCGVDDPPPIRSSCSCRDPSPPSRSHRRCLTADLLYGSAKAGKFQYDKVLNVTSKTADGVVSCQGGCVRRRMADKGVAACYLPPAPITLSHVYPRARKRPARSPLSLGLGRLPRAGALALAGTARQRFELLRSSVHSSPCPWASCRAGVQHQCGGQGRQAGHGAEGQLRGR